MSPAIAIAQDESSIPAGVPGRDEVLTRAGGENFPVALQLLGASTRCHLMNVYGFARLADELGDSAAGDRLDLLNWLDEEVSAVYAECVPAHPVMRRLISTIRAKGIPEEPFRHIIRANRQDQSVGAYPTFERLAAYCNLSANPIGHLVLHVFEALTPERVELSDYVCTALQLVEHWQDVAEDYANGRVYVPQEDLDRFSCQPEDLGGSVATPEFRRLMEFEVQRATDLLDRGAPISRLLPGAYGMAMAAFVEGGRAALDSIRDADFDVLSRSPRPSLRHKARAARTLMGLWMSW